MTSPDEARALGEKHVESCEQWKAHARKILERECSDEQKIEGVPEGWRLVYVQLEDATMPRHPDGIRRSAIVLLERIPKPKRRVLVAEWDLEAKQIALPHDTQLATAPRRRIEERDA